MINWIAFVLIGKLLIVLGMKFPLFQGLSFFSQLFACDLCLGVWVYAGLAGILRVDILPSLGWAYIPVASEFITGAVISFLVHIFSLGWKAKYEVIYA